jgi:hypothetical protein
MQLGHVHSHHNMQQQHKLPQGQTARLGSSSSSRQLHQVLLGVPLHHHAWATSSNSSSSTCRQYSSSSSTASSTVSSQAGRVAPGLPQVPLQQGLVAPPVSNTLAHLSSSSSR